MELYFITIISVLSVTLFYVSTPIVALEECSFPAIFNFGDSNSDTGGLSAAFGQAQPPAGETFFHTPSGRYCDGRLVIDFIAESFGLPYLSAYLDAVGSNFTHGVNFATAGSSIRPENESLSVSGFSPISGNVQWYQYNEFCTRSQVVRKRSEFFAKLLPKEECFSNGLYTFDLGQNDLTTGLFANKSIAQVKADVPDILGKLSTIIKLIYDQGGRSFWIHNTGPVGCLPYVLDLMLITAPQVDAAGCATPFNELCQYFNLKLKESVAQLRKDLPLAAFTYVDVYSVKYALIRHSRKYGFEQPLRACCGHGGKYNYNRHVGCGGKIMVNGTQVLLAKSCKDPSIRVNWDGVHYTEAANKFVFDKIKDGSYSDPPIPLKMACHRQHH